MPVSTIPAQGGLVVTGTVLDRMAQAAQPWTSYTPTITNVTTSSTTARYHRHGDKVTVEFELTLSAAPTGAVTISLPVNASTTFNFQTTIRGMVGGYDTSAPALATGFVRVASATTADFLTPGATTAQWSPGIPVAWASGDVWGGTFTYEAA